MPLYDVVIFFLKGLTEGRLTLRASSISFDFFLALFPVIIVFFTLIPFIPITGFQEELLHFLEDVIPSTLWIHVSETLEDIIFYCIPTHHTSSKPQANYGCKKLTCYF
jgi:membrane protein